MTRVCCNRSQADLLAGPVRPVFRDSLSDETRLGATKPFPEGGEGSRKRPPSRIAPPTNIGESAMNNEPIGTGATTAEVWQMAQRRRTAEMATLFGRPADDGARRRRLALPTLLVALVAAVAVWALAGPPLHPGKTVVATIYAKAR